VTSCDGVAFTVLEKVCGERNSKLADVKPMISDVNSSIDGVSFKLKTPTGAYRLSSRLRGLFQAENIACAVVAAEAFGVSKDKIVSGVSKTFWPGRLDVMQEHPMVIIDCAHNPDGLEKTLGFVRKLDYEKLFVVCGFSADKDFPKMVGMLSFADVLIAVKSKNERALETRKIIEKSKNQCKIAFESVLEGVENALEVSCERDLILVVGSIFVAGEAISKWRKRF